MPQTARPRRPRPSTTDAKRVDESFQVPRVLGARWGAAGGHRQAVRQTPEALDRRLECAPHAGEMKTKPLASGEAIGVEAGSGDRGDADGFDEESREGYVVVEA